MGRRWTDAERELLCEQYKRRPPGEIAAVLDRTEKAIIEQAYHLGIIGRVREYRRRKAPQLLSRTGVPYKTVIPQEKWPLIQHFLGSLQHYAGRAEDAGVAPDVGAFMAEYGGHHRGRRTGR